MKTIKDYYETYLKCDVLLIADVFEKFEFDVFEIIMDYVQIII